MRGGRRLLPGQVAGIVVIEGPTCGAGGIQGRDPRVEIGLRVETADLGGGDEGIAIGQ